LIALPVKTGIKSVLGSSMVTELLSKGISLDVISDFGTNLNTIISSLSFGLFLILLLGGLMNVFLAGGLFSILKQSEKKPSAALFFEGGASNFLSFLIITVVSSLMILFIGFIIIGVPAMIAGSSSQSEGAGFRTARLFAMVLALILPVFLLVADYARAWQVTRERKKAFKALGFGFSQTFRTFLSSYPVMIILFIIQVLFGWMVLNKLLGSYPVTGGGVFLMFLISQILFFVKVLLRGWRYGSVTSLMEMNPEKPSDNSKVIVTEKSLYQFSARTLQGIETSMEICRGKVVLVVNTASKCGFTPQYEGLEKLYQTYKERGLVILGFPCNQFANQEPGTEAEIAEGCLINYGVSFPMFSKVEVNGNNADPIFKYLKSRLHGFTGKRIKWNFTKFLIDANGIPVKRFSPATKPENLVKDIEKLLR
jgi:glutathione peroxidase